MPNQAYAKILLVDGDAFFASACAASLESEGFSVLCVTDGEQGLSVAAREIPDAILLDMKAPKLDGFEFLRRLKNDQELCDVPVLMLAEQERIEDAERCFKEGATEYLVKAHLVPGDAARNVKRVLQLS
ncbi:MAG: response regulator [Patescibacteria group bacterium]|jgi:two-component system alkaline phosphatase synthesis response regulator PhoP